jgi:hypothetical protein
MSQVVYDVTRNEEPRNRLTTAFRIILAIPHLILVSVWQYAVEIVSVIQWFIILFTGKRNRGLWDFSNSWLGYYSRVYSYAWLLFDEYPAFGTDPGTVPARYELTDTEPPNRLTNGLRIIWAIPALLISAALAIAAFFVLIVAWFAILFTGKLSDGMFGFVKKVLHYLLQTSAYVALMTDTYPAWGGTVPATSDPLAAPPPPPPAPEGV